MYCIAQWLEYLTGHQKVTGCTHMQPSLIALVHVVQWLEHLTSHRIIVWLEQVNEILKSKTVNYQA